MTFTSTGRDNGGSVTTTQATYAYTQSVTPAGSAELVFFNSGSSSVYFTNNVMPQSDGSKATILFPGGGSFECKTTIPGNVITAGSIKGQSGCTIDGSVFIGGQNPVDGKALYLNNSDQILGSAVVVGNVLMGNSPAKITGTLTIPSTAQLTTHWAAVSGKPTTDAQIYSGKPGGIIWSTTLGKPVLDPWYDYNYAASDWPGYDKVTLTETSSPYNCTNWKGKISGASNTFWTGYLTGLVKNTVIDARACKGGMDTDQGATSVAQLGVNVVFLANAYTLGKLTISPKAGTMPSVWFIVPDKIDDDKPSCPAADSTNQWDYRIESDATINVTVNAMLYTPCAVRIGQGGTWTGSMYAGNFEDGGGINIYTHSMGLPGQWGLGPGGVSTSTSTSLGELIASRDIASGD